MKKILFTLLAACALVACEKDDDKTPVAELDSVSYSCDLTVVMGGQTMMQKSGLICDLNEQTDGSYTLTMEAIQFVPQMPGQTIDITELTRQPTATEVVNYVSVDDPIIPQIAGKPYPQQAITNFTCVENRLSKQFDLQFDCMGGTATLTGTLVE